MTHAMKGALLSGLVLPGLGHLVLGCFYRGTALLVGFLAVLSAVTVNVLRQAQALLDKMLAGDMPLSLERIIETAHEAARSQESDVVRRLVYLIIFGWVVGIVDAYRIGRRKDLAPGGSLPLHGSSRK